MHVGVHSSVYGLHGPALMARSGSGVAIGFAVAYVLMLVLCLFVFLRSNAPRDDHGTDSGEGGWGGPPGGGRPPVPSSPHGGADWWPEFERQFAAYVELSSRRLEVGASHFSPARR
jgi:hypothetical protein